MRRSQDRPREEIVSVTRPSLVPQTEARQLEDHALHGLQAVSTQRASAPWFARAGSRNSSGFGSSAPVPTVSRRPASAAISGREAFRVLPPLRITSSAAPRRLSTRGRPLFLLTDAPQPSLGGGASQGKQPPTLRASRKPKDGRPQKNLACDRPQICMDLDDHHRQFPRQRAL
jgi:hypothetical protein